MAGFINNTIQSEICFRGCTDLVFGFYALSHLEALEGVREIRARLWA